MTIETITLFLTLMLPICWSAGPNNIMCASIGGRYGIKRTFPFIVGINLVNIVYAIGVGFGLATLIEQYPQILEIVKYLGAAYIFYLAFKFMTTNTDIDEEKSTPGFKDGIIICALNGKCITAIALMYSQTLNPELGNVLQVLVISTAFIIICVLGHLIWAIGGKGITSLFRSKKTQKIQNYIFGGLLFAVGTWIVFN